MTRGNVGRDDLHNVRRCARSLFSPLNSINDFSADQRKCVDTSRATGRKRFSANFARVVKQARRARSRKHSRLNNCSRVVKLYAPPRAVKNSARKRILCPCVFGENIARVACGTCHDFVNNKAMKLRGALVNALSNNPQVLHVYLVNIPLLVRRRRFRQRRLISVVC